jgi:hypothetical protein
MRIVMVEALQRRMWDIVENERVFKARMS